MSQEPDVRLMNMRGELLETLLPKIKAIQGKDHTPEELLLLVRDILLASVFDYSAGNAVRASVALADIMERREAILGQLRKETASIDVKQQLSELMERSRRAELMRKVD